MEGIMKKIPKVEYLIDLHGHSKKYFMLIILGWILLPISQRKKVLQQLLVYKWQRDYLGFE